MIKIPINKRNAPSIDIAFAVVVMSHSPNIPDCVRPRSANNSKVNPNGMLGFPSVDFTLKNRKLTEIRYTGSGYRSGPIFV